MWPTSTSELPCQRAEDLSAPALAHRGEIPERASVSLAAGAVDVARPAAADPTGDNPSRRHGCVFRAPRRLMLEPWRRPARRRPCWSVFAALDSAQRRNSGPDGRSR
jgi:hypothetical protein